MNLHATILTYPAPSANYRGERELYRTVIQKITGPDNLEYGIISPEAMRNALREILAKQGLPCNRERLHDEEQLAVKFASLPDAAKYVDDFLFGYLVAASGKDREKMRKESGRPDLTFKRDSILRMNLAKALTPYRHNSVFTQSPLSTKDSAYKNSDSSALLHRETTDTAFQYPFGLNLEDCRKGAHGAKWSRALIEAIGQLSGVAGNHARSLYEMAPASIVARLGDSLVAGYNLYGFSAKGDFPEVVDGLLRDPADYPAAEFYLGGKIVKDMSEADITTLTVKGVTLDRDPRRLLGTIADKAKLTA